MWKEMVRFVETLQRYPAKKCEICNWIKRTFRHRGGQCSSLYSQYIFRLYLQKWRGCFVNTLHKAGNHSKHYSCHLIVESFSEQVNLKKQITTTFCTNLSKKETRSIYGNVAWQWLQKLYKSNSFWFQNHSLSFIVKNYALLSATSVLSPSPMAYNTTVPWTS